MSLVWVYPVVGFLVVLMIAASARSAVNHFVEINPRFKKGITERKTRWKLSVASSLYLILNFGMVAWSAQYFGLTDAQASTIILSLIVTLVVLLVSIYGVVTLAAQSVGATEVERKHDF